MDVMVVASTHLATPWIDGCHHHIEGWVHGVQGGHQAFDQVHSLRCQLVFMSVGVKYIMAVTERPIRAQLGVLVCGWINQNGAALLNARAVQSDRLEENMKGAQLALASQLDNELAGKDIAKNEALVESRPSPFSIRHAFNTRITFLLRMQTFS